MEAKKESPMPRHAKNEDDGQKSTSLLGEFKTALVLFGFFTLLTGLFYPLAITALAQLFFRTQAEGSLVRVGGLEVGSVWIGQKFDDPRYFWGRPSATSPDPFTATNSGGANLGPAHPQLLAQVQARIVALRQADPSNTLLIPVDLVTASASGLDPHLSPAAAFYQAGRVARVRHLPRETVEALIEQHTAHRFLGVFGEEAVCVLALNIALDTVAAEPPLRPKLSAP